MLAKGYTFYHILQSALNKPFPVFLINEFLSVFFLSAIKEFILLSVS
jgi:hypothetical protein